MKRNILNAIWVTGLLALAVFCLSACNHELDIQQAYPFTVETMPVQKSIVKGQTVEIRCTLKRQGKFANTRYTIRYFQPDGKGRLKMDDSTVFKPNERYPFLNSRSICCLSSTPKKMFLIRSGVTELSRS